MQTCKARNCVVGFGIPTSRDEYIESVLDPRGRDLISGKRLSWPQYQAEIVDRFEKLAPSWSTRGVRVATGVRSDNFGALFEGVEPQVVVLISHWQNEAIELLDGMADSASLSRSIPASFDGLIDLCVCQSIGLAKAIKQFRPAVTVKMVDAPALYGFWFYVYTATFRLLEEGDVSYPDALAAALISFGGNRVLENA